MNVEIGNQNAMALEGRIVDHPSGTSNKKSAKTWRP
jgi:hypothetical protein